MCTYLHGPRAGGMYYFRRGVPLALRPIIGKREFLITLGVKDRSEAKRLIADHTKATDALLSHAEGMLAARHLPATEPSPTDPQEQARWENRIEAGELDLRRSTIEDDHREALEPITKLWEQRLSLPASELSPDEAALKYMQSDRADDLSNAMTALASVRARVGHDPAIDASMASHSSDPAVSIGAMFEGYAAQPGLRSATVRQFRAIIEHLIAFLGHDDALRVGQQDLMRWRKHLQTELSKGGRPRAPKTINGSYMAAANVTFAYGLNEAMIPTNPMAAVGKVRALKAVKVREKDFTPQEQIAILSTTLLPQPDNLAAEHAFARRWVPWLCAYTGARVNEITQLRREDVSERDGIWTINITPEAGAIKTDEARLVPMHEHLVAQGFAVVVGSMGSGPLFYGASRRAGTTDRQPNKRMGMRLAQWVRSLGVDDPGIKPNHAWRHTFKTIALEAGMQERAADYIQGHASKGVGRSYGSNTIAALAAQLALFPRFPIDTP